MATHDYIISNASGAAVRADLNNALAAIATNNSSATEPTTTYAYQWWADTGSSPTVMKLRNAANSGWITLFQLDGEWTVVPFENGTAAAPSIYFKDSGTDTGIYSPGTDQVGISAGGTSRFEVSTSATTSTLPVVHPLGAVGTPSITFTGDLNTGIWSPAADTVAASTGGSERLRIDSSGRVGIGTTSPGSPLQVNGTGGIKVNEDGAGTNEIQLRSNWAGAGPAINVQTNQSLIFTTNATERARIDTSGRWLLGTSSSTAFTRAVVAGNSFDATGVLTVSNTGSSIADGGQLAELQFSDSEHGKVAAVVRTNRDGGTWSGTSKPTRLIFGTTADGATAPTERMRIDNRGRVNVGGTGGLNAGFTVDWPANALEPVVINDTSNTAGQTHRISFRTGGTETGKIISGTTLGTSYVTSSDYRLKQGIVDLGDGVGRLVQLKPRRFSFINSPETVIDGFVAHEVQDIVPEAITGEKDAVDADGKPIYQGIDHSRLVPLLTAALQEAIVEIESLKARLTAAGI